MNTAYKYDWQRSESGALIPVPHRTAGIKRARPPIMGGSHNLLSPPALCPSTVVYPSYGGIVNVGNQLIPPAPQNIALRYDTEIEDQLGIFNPAIPDRFVIKSTGVYEVFCNFYTDIGRSASSGKVPNGGVIACAVQKVSNPGFNVAGQDYGLGDIRNYSNILDAPGFVFHSTPIPVTAGDALQIFGFQFNYGATGIGAAMTSAQTTLSTTHDISSSTFGWQSGEVAWLQDTDPPECILLNTVSSFGASTITRGYLGTTAVAHAQYGLCNRGSTASAGSHCGGLATLNGAITNATNPIIVSPWPSLFNLAAFQNADYMAIEPGTANCEIVGINGVPGSLGTSIPVNRGQQNTTAIAHNSGVTVATGKFLFAGSGFTSFGVKRLA